LDILTDANSLSTFTLRVVRNVRVVRDHVMHSEVHGLGTFLAEQVAAWWCAMRVCVLDGVKTEAADFAIVEVN